MNMEDDTVAEPDQRSKEQIYYDELLNEYDTTFLVLTAKNYDDLLERMRQIESGKLYFF
jgi:hypothetical protein